MPSCKDKDAANAPPLRDSSAKGRRRPTLKGEERLERTGPADWVLGKGPYTGGVSASNALRAVRGAIVQSIDLLIQSAW